MINLFGLEVELWRIGDSAIAPKFNVVSQPNDWSTSVKQAAAGTELTPYNQLQLKFWTAYKQYLESVGSLIKSQKPFPQTWMNHSIGRSGIFLASIISSWNSENGMKSPEVRAELTLNGPKAKDEFAVLEGQKEEIERELGFSLTWYNQEGYKSCRAYTRKDADFLDETRWPEILEWLRQRQEIMYKVFRPRIKRSLNLSIGGVEQ